MDISYGPPGQRGVATIMSVGADEALSSPPAVDVLVTAGVVTWALGFFTGSRTMERVGFWGGLAALGWKIVR